MKKDFILSADFETTSIKIDDFKTAEEYESALNEFQPEVYSWALAYRKINADPSNPSVDNYIIDDGINIDTFFEKIFSLDQDYTIYFHNGSKFDLQWVLSWLYKNGFKEFIVQKKDLADLSTFKFEKENYENLVIEEKGRYLNFGEYSTLVDDQFKIMQLRLAIPSIKGKKNRVVTFRDSNLMFASTLKKYGESLNKMYNTDFYSKGSIFYNRKELYKSYEEFENDGDEKSYLHMDVIILIEFLHMMIGILPFHKWKITAASTTYDIWKYDFFGKKLLDQKVESGDIIKFKPKNSKGDFFFYKYKDGKYWSKSNKIIDRLIKRILPTDWLDSYTIDGMMSNFTNIKPSYQGGLTMANPDYAGMDVQNILYADINSSYPTQMLNGNLPYGNPIYDEDECKENVQDYCILYNVKVNAKNENGLPFLFDYPKKVTRDNEIKDGNGKFYSKNVNREYILTDEELERVKKYYKGKIEYEFLVGFEKTSGKFLFGEFINYFYEMKSSAGNDLARKLFAKLMLNSLYGKFGQDIERSSRIFVEGEWMQYSTISTASFYLPLAIWITSLGRMYMVDGVGSRFRFVNYIDTDSISVITKNVDLKNDEECKKYLEKYFNLKIGDGLGEWDIEYKISRMRTRRAKQYYFKDINGIPHIKFAGLRISEYQNNKDLEGEEYDEVNKDINRLNFKNFTEGISGFSQLRPLRFATGILLEEYEKQIKPIWEYNLNPSYWFQNEEEYKKGNKKLNINKIKL